MAPPDRRGAGGRAAWIGRRGNPAPPGRRGALDPRA